MPKHPTTARVLIEHVERLGFTVDVTGSDGRVVLSAVDLKTGEAFTVRAPLADAYDAAARLKIPVETTLQLGKGVTMKLVLIPAGKFLMGSPKAEGAPTERPQRQVTISRPFYMGLTEVTQAQWRAVMGTEPWKGKVAKEDRENAASYVSWDDAVAFCRKVS